MSLPEVGQAEMLANELCILLADFAPTSVALGGCAGGNGFTENAEAGASRIVGIDINADYLKRTKARYAATIGGLGALLRQRGGGCPSVPTGSLGLRGLDIRVCRYGKSIEKSA